MDRDDFQASAIEKCQTGGAPPSLRQSFGVCTGIALSTFSRCDGRAPSINGMGLGYIHQSHLWTRGTVTMATKVVPGGLSSNKVGPADKITVSPMAIQISCQKRDVCQLRAAQ